MRDVFIVLSQLEGLVQGNEKNYRFVRVRTRAESSVLPSNANALGDSLEGKWKTHLKENKVGKVKGGQETKRDGDKNMYMNICKLGKPGNIVL